MFWPFPYLVLGHVLRLLLLLVRGDRSKESEILLLWHQVAVLRRQVASDRMLVVILAVGDRDRWSGSISPARPIQRRISVLRRRW
ncbi:hypothetical protein GCM10009780_20170 [Actinomadura alba]